MDHARLKFCKTLKLKDYVFVGRKGIRNFSGATIDGKTRRRRFLSCSTFAFLCIGGSHVLDLTEIAVIWSDSNHRLLMVELCKQRLGDSRSFRGIDGHWFLMWELHSFASGLLDLEFGAGAFQKHKRISFVVG